MNLAELNKVAVAMTANGRGILAAAESSSTIKMRFDAIRVESTADSWRDHRQLLVRSTDPMKSHSSGVILYDETIRQNAKDGTPLVKVVERVGSLPGIKVDKGTTPLPYCPGEVITEGLDGLRERLAEYRGLGAKFTKWRAVIDIGACIPTWSCVKANAHALARYAALCQEEQVVPIVEPEVLMDGGHDIDTCYGITEWVLCTVYNALFEARAARRHRAQTQHGDPRQEVGQAGFRREDRGGLKATVPATVPGIAFLSGGQSDEEATAHLDAMNRIGGLSWTFTFSEGRTLSAAHDKGADVGGRLGTVHRSPFRPLSKI